jgi:hypothetical protein
MTFDTAKDLQTAYDILEHRGWCKGNFAKGDGHVCLDGALRRATLGSQNTVPIIEKWNPQTDEQSDRLAAAQKKLADTIALDYPVDMRTGVPNHTKIWGWNDDPDSTVEDVKLILKKAVND